MRTARANGTKVILAHEVDPALGGCEFGYFFQTTPGDLIGGGLYGAIAVAMHSGQHRAVSYCLVAKDAGAVRVRLKEVLKNRGDAAVEAVKERCCSLRSEMRKSARRKRHDLAQTSRSGSGDGDDGDDGGGDGGGAAGATATAHPPAATEHSPPKVAQRQRSLVSLVSGETREAELLRKAELTAVRARAMRAQRSSARIVSERTVTLTTAGGLTSTATLPTHRHAHRTLTPTPPSP